MLCCKAKVRVVRRTRMIDGVPVGSIVSCVRGELEASRCFGDIWSV